MILNYKNINMYYKNKDKHALFRAEFPLVATEQKYIKTKDDYIEELERQLCEKEDRIQYEVNQWYHYYIPERLKWKLRALKLEAENKVLKSYIDKAQRLTNRDLKEWIDEEGKKEKNQGK